MTSRLATTDSLGARHDAVAPGLTIRPFSLSFSRHDAERAFRDEYFRRSLRVIQLSIGLGVLLYGGFAVLDLWIVPDRLTEMWVIRFGIVCPFLLLVLGLSFTSVFRRVSQAALIMTMLVTGNGIIAMTALTNEPGNYLYYAGLLNTVIYCTSMIRVRFIYAAVVAAALVGTYEFVGLYVNPLPPGFLLNNTFFFVTAVGVGLFAGYFQELFARQGFIKNWQLAEEKARSEQLLAQARAANHAKTEFLAMMSHELRTPLNAVIGFSEAMTHQIMGPMGNEVYVGYAGDIHRSGTHLLGIINDILDLTKAEAGKFELDEETLDVEGILAASVRLVETQARKGQVDLRHVPRPDLPLLRADRRVVTQIVINLLSNAVKFTPSGGHVEVKSLVDANGALVMTFEDTGIGIPAEHIERVMEPFTQVESSMNRSHDGTGLGLPLVKKMVELHGGTIGIDSTVGAGTSVAVSFPPGRVCKPAARDETAPLETSPETAAEHVRRPRLAG